MSKIAETIDAHRRGAVWVGDGVKIDCMCGHISHAIYDLTSGPITEDNNNHRRADRMHAQHVLDMIQQVVR